MGKASEILAEFITERLTPGVDTEAIDKKIWGLFGETWAVFISDMSGFTRRTEEFGIIHFLAQIHEMQRISKPIILAHYGFILKTEADNLFVTFRHAEQAVRCAIEVHQALAQYNVDKGTDFQISLCIGIGYGKVLKLGD